MFEAIMPSKRKAQQPQQSVNSAPTESELLASINEQIVDALAECERCSSDAARFSAQAVVHDAAVQAATAARENLTALHAGQIAGEDIGDHDIEMAERTLRDSMGAAAMAGPAGAGARAAAKRAEEQYMLAHGRIAALRAQRQPYLSIALREKAKAAQARLDAAVMALRVVQAEVETELRAIGHLGRSNGVGNPSEAAIPAQQPERVEPSADFITAMSAELAALAP